VFVRDQQRRRNLPGCGVAFRVLRSAVHCTVNKVLVRFLLYVISTLALWFMIIRAALNLW
jgi:hypothetical protein